MRGILVLLVLLLGSSAASAQTCPDFYRFVDFGLTGGDGVTYRGGIVLRAEGFDGAPLLLTAQTLCRDVRDLAVDGRGNPIPVVAAVTYDPAAAGIALRDLRVALWPDALAEAQEAAAAHLAAVHNPNMTVARGEDYLCALAPTGAVSCQVQPPFPNQAPVVAYCDAGLCRMPVMAINATLAVGAAWSSDVADPAAIGAQVAQKVRQIHDFLVPLSAAF
ncbi:hypothetical protein [Yoonia sp.]|uniref:hypothetical protein n=1 Tax=Yoonia sp. TaxID=2212373 RepID=UPI002DFEC1BC|nr:hypothetical protein [Yoonia sp.]